MPARKPKTTTRYVAFLRAINVGSHIVKMDRLRSLFEELGFTNVETFIASGNVIFESLSTDTEKLEKAIERHLRQALGYEVATFVRSTAEVCSIAAHQPFGEPGEESIYIALARSTPATELQAKLIGLRNEIDDFHVRDREVYWLCRTSMSKSQFSGARLEKVLGMPATLRNVTTMQRLAAKYPVT
jgi:uncharacterized protein (DUF1697 family)